MFLINGCSLYTAPKAPTINTPKSFKENLKINNHGLETSWWKNFKDDKLNHLVDRAIHKNLIYEQALANIKIARTYVSETNLNRFPDFNIGNSAYDFNFRNNSWQFNGIKAPTLNGDVAFNYLYGSVSYELDIWNKKSNINHMSKVNVEISKADSRSVQLALISEVVYTYYQIASLNSMINNLQQQHSYANTSISILKLQYRHGLVDKSAIEGAKNFKEQINSNLSSVKKMHKTSEYHLAYLLGDYPEAFHYSVRPISTSVNFNAFLPQTVPARVLANRPDVQRAFLEIVSFDYLKKQTLADFFPSTNLFAFIGKENLTFPLIAQSSLMVFYGFNFVEKLTEFAKNASRYERSKELYLKSILNYRDTVLNAFQEVNIALVSYKEDQKNLNSQRNIVSNTNIQLTRAHKQYRAGSIDFNTYLQVKADMLQKKYDLLNQNLLAYRDIIQIYKSMGIGNCNKIRTCIGKKNDKHVMKS